jgi:hypothetical protein
MSNDQTIKQVVQAKPGSVLEKTVSQILKDLQTNLNRLKETYQKKTEKQQNKIDRKL